MSGAPTGSRPRSWRRWPLGTLMTSIALMAVPLGWYVHHRREEGRRRAEASYIKRLVGVLNERLEFLPGGAGEQRR